MNNRCPGLKEINPFNLHVTTYTKSGLELLGQAIRKSFEVKCPSARKNMYPRFMGHQFPAQRSDSNIVSSDSFHLPPFLGMRTVDGLSVNGAVRSRQSWGGHEDVGLDISDNKGASVICQARRHVGQEN